LNKKFDYKKIWKRALWASGMLILLLFTIIWYQVIAYNNDEYVTDNNNADSKVYFEADSSNTVSDRWNTVIQISENYDDNQVYTGATISSHVVNKNNYDIKDWTLSIKVNDECYLNSFWCGSVIVNQHRDGKDISCEIESQYADFTQLNADMNKYSESMMIHLVPGDEIVYIPSVQEKEDVVKENDSIGIGFIIYYQNSFDMAEWNISYHNNINMASLIYTKIAVGLSAIWIGALIFYLCIVSIEKKMQEQMNNRVKNISIMSDIYLEAYIIDISKDSARLIKGSADSLIAKLEGSNVQENLNRTIKDQCQPAFQEELLSFFDLSTVKERMAGATSITTEFIGNSFGWCAVRIFKEAENDNNIVITLQDINEEKKKLRLIEERISMAEYKQHVSGSFLGTVSFALNDISLKVGNDAREIINISDDNGVKTLADKVICNTRHMNLIQNTMLDLYHIESQTSELNIHRYCVRDMLDELHHILAAYAVGKDYEFTFDVDESIPEFLVGDSDRIEQILVIILFSSLLMTKQGYVSFALYGKQIDDEEELIFSIRDTAGGFSKEQIDEIYAFINGSSIETFDNASLVYLKIINGILNFMNSELKIVSVLGEGTDFYFTLRQGISEE